MSRVKGIRQTAIATMVLLGVMLMTVSAQAGEIFNDNFETGDLSNWDSVLVEAGNTVEVIGDAAHEGSFGLHVQTTGVNDDARIGKQIAPTTQLYTKVWLNMQQNVGAGNHQQILVLASHRDDSNAKIGALALRRTSDNPADNVYTLAYSGSGPQPWEDSGEDLEIGEWACVEMYVKVSPTEGQLTLWINGVVVADSVPVNTGSLPITWIRLGADGTEVAGDYYFDEFAADDATRIACEDAPPPPPPPPPGDGGEGCTPGFWKNHTGAWVGYATTDDPADVFGVANVFAGTDTLLTALQQGGGGAKALGRHATAALLNASSGEVDYDMNVAGIIALVQDAYVTGDYEGAKNILANFNEQGCPTNGKSAGTPDDGDDDEEDEEEDDGPGNGKAKGKKK